MAKVLAGTEAWTAKSQYPVKYIAFLASLTLWSREVDDIAIRLEHVDLLNGRNWLDVHLLESGLQLLVVGAGALVDLLDLSSRGALSSITISLMPNHDMSQPLRKVFAQRQSANYMCFECSAS